MHKKNRLDNIELIRKHDQIKFVIKNKDDYTYAKNIYYIYKPTCEVFFQPVWGRNHKKIAEWIISDGLNVRLNLQLHKLIWGLKKGV
jgi:7-carboxy-7-deazaguanine synthase